MTCLNVSARLPYHSQVNNRLYPLSSCNTTSAIMWLLDCHVPFEFPANMQPEDYLTSITELPECYDYMRRAAPWAWDRDRPKLPPRQVHVCLAWAVNRLCGREVMRFREDVSYEQLAAELACGRAALMSGQFTQAGHVICLVGLTSRQPVEGLRDPAHVRLDQIVSWAVDDPYGDYHSCYQDRRGNDVVFLFDEFDRLTREPCRNRKWAHLRTGA